ncbi:hypothetical protein H0E87_027836, partial [Populus deltoides]
VPGGPAYTHLEPGDILFRVNGEVVTQFLKLETLLDDSVDQKIVLQIERGWHAIVCELNDQLSSVLKLGEVAIAGISVLICSYKANSH